MKKILILFLVMILIIPSLLFADGTDFDFDPDIKQVPSEPVRIIKNENGTFEEISYIISTTGGSTNIRYRTSEIRIVVAGNVYRLNTLELQQLVPKAGETVHSMITITAEHIINGMNKERARIGLPPLSESEISVIKNDLNDPSKIEIEATIDIYNKATGKVLDRIRDINDISKIAGKYGFSQKHMKDMETRFRNKPLNNSIPQNEEVPKSGLRPTGIRR